ADIDNAKANGYTLIDGGYIQTDLLDVDDIIASGDIIVLGDSITGLEDRTADNIDESSDRKWAGESGADVTQDALDAGADIDNAKANGHTFISGGYVATEILTADNIQTGKLKANNVRVESGDGNTYFDGNTIYVYDEEGKIRVKIGEL
ncbi:MAG: hypothetical protein ACOCQ0_02860, partial [Desulfosalsimonas sp.]